MDDAFLMRVLERLADRQEQLQTLARCELVCIAVLGDRCACDQLHHEVRTASRLEAGGGRREVGGRRREGR